MKAQELRDMTAEELASKGEELRREHFNLRVQSVTGDIHNPMRIRTVKRDLARVLTILNEKNRALAGKKAEG